ncbi:MAG TPA: tetratricopeptide repeat protein [Methanotrichaceae archaeon]|nr:tetratricopeptide repeat protein [Methanotrichaceae archaeon]
MALVSTSLAQNSQNLTGLLLQGDELLHEKSYSNAIETYNQVLAADPHLAHAWLKKGIALDMSGRYHDAIRSYNNALELDPNLTDAWYNRGLALSSLGRYDEAVRSYDQTLNLNKSYISAWNGKGTVFMKMGRYKEASDAFDQTLKICPTDPFALCGKGLALNKMGRYEEAVSYFENATSLNPDMDQAWYGLGMALQNSNQPEEAVMAFSHARDAGPGLLDKRGVFLIFLTAYLALAASGYVVSRRHRVPTAITILTVNLLSFVAFGWILSGFLDIELVGIFIAGGLLMALLAGTLWILLGSPTTPCGVRSIWTFLEWEKRQILPAKAFRVICIFAVIVYAVMAIDFYFRFGLISEQMTVSMIRAALILILLMSSAVTLPPIIAVLMSMNLDKDTRNLVLVTQFGYLGMAALFLPVILWIMGIDNDKYPFQLSSVALSVSPLLLIILASLFIFALIIPYLSGWHRGKKWRELLLTKERTWLEDLLEVLTFPTPELFIPKLESILARSKEEKRIFTESNFLKEDMIEETMMKLSEEEIIYKAHIMQMDPRLSYLEFLDNLQARISECICQMKKAKADEGILRVAESYVGAYSSRKDKIDQAIEVQRSTRPQLWIGAILAMAPVMDQVLSNLMQPTLITWVQRYFTELSPMRIV